MNSICTTIVYRYCNAADNMNSKASTYAGHFGIDICSKNLIYRKQVDVDMSNVNI